jgi:hypothetical protein
MKIIKIAGSFVVISTSIIVCYLAIFEQYYDLKFVDQLADSIIEHPDESKVKELLLYQRYHSVDASFSLHYYATIWFVNEKHPDLLLKYRKGRYQNILERMVKEGAACFADYYPQGRR